MIKRMIKTTFILMCVLCFCFVFFITAMAENGDSFNPYREDNWPVGESQDVLLFFNGSYLNGFVEHKSVESLLDEPYTLEKIIVTYTPFNINEFSRYSLRNGNANLITNGPIDDGSAYFLEKKSQNIISIVEKKVHKKINRTVCLSGSLSMDGIYICFETNDETYVLFKENQRSKYEYFFTLEEFYDIADKYQKELLNRLYDENGNVRKGATFSFSDMEGIDSYLFKPQNEYGLMISVVAVFVLIAVSVTILLVKKSKIQKAHKYD